MTFARRRLGYDAADPASALIAFCEKYIPPVARAEFDRLVSALGGETAEDSLPEHLRRRVREGIAKKAAATSAALDEKFPDLGRIGQS